MQLKRTALLCLALSVAAVTAGVVYARELGAKEARRIVADLVGGGQTGQVRIKSVSPGLTADQMVVTAEVELAFKLVQENGKWRASDVRLGDNRWEEIEMLRRALDAEKAKRAEADLRTLAAGVEAYRRERGFLPEAETGSALVDRITPRFLPAVVRQDPWHQPFYYHVVATGYRLGSSGPDGREATADDVVVNGN